MALADLEAQAAALVLRYQDGDPQALVLLRRRLQVLIASVILHYWASQSPPRLTLRDLQRQSRIALAEVTQHWRPGTSFLGYFFRAFPRQLALALSTPSPHARGLGGRSAPQLDRGLGRGAVRSQAPSTASPPDPLSELERQIVHLRDVESQGFPSIARHVGVPPDTTHRIYLRARARLAAPRPSASTRPSVAMQRLVTALHAAASPDGRLPGRAWAMASIGLKRAEYEELIGQLEAAGAIHGRHHRVAGHLAERTRAATLARLATRTPT